MQKDISPLTFRDLVNLFPENLSSRAFEFIFLSSNKVKNLETYYLYREERIDFYFRLSQKNRKKLLDVNYPLQRLTKTAFFCNTKFVLMERVFIPRSETEQLVNLGIEWVKKLGLSSFSYIDLCTGSGALICSFLSHFKERIFSSVGVDIDFVACKNTLLNLSILKLKSEVYLSNWVDFLRISNRWEVMTINPPYLGLKELGDLNRYDTKISLVTVDNGLAHYTLLLNYLKNNLYWKLVLVECSEFHQRYWEEIINSYSFLRISKYLDHLGKFRVVVITRNT